METAIDRVIADPEQLYSTENYLKDGHETVIKYAQSSSATTRKEFSYAIATSHQVYQNQINMCF